MGYKATQGFDERFVRKLVELQDEYGTEIFDIDGIGPKSLDIQSFHNKFFSNLKIADVTVDGNSNVDNNTVLSFEQEQSKALHRLYGYYSIWNKIVSNPNGGVKRANKVLENCIVGPLKIHDLHLINKSYSYYQETPIIIRVNGVIKYITLKQLFDSYKEFVEIYDDREQINCNLLKKEIDFADNLIIVQGKKGHFIKEDKINARVNEIHTIEVLDNNNKWTKITKIIRHKTDSNLIAYQTNNGDYAVVTDNHPIIMEDGSEKLARELKIDDPVKYTSNELNFEEYINIDDDLAYLTGFVIGDGNVSQHKFIQSNNITNNDLCIKFSSLLSRFTLYQKDMKSHKIYKVIKKLFPCTYCECKDKTTNNNGYIRLKNVKEDEDFNWLAFTSKRYKLLCAKYFDLDYTNASYTKTLPSNILNWTKSSKESLIAGLLDSDGTIIDNGVCNIQLTSYALINQLYDVIKTISKYRVNKRFCENNFKHEFAISFIPTDNMYIYSEKLQGKPKRNWNEYNENYDSNVRNNKIKKISIVDPSNLPKRLDYNLKMLDHVYDITTESGTFYANGMLQHNCYGFSLDEMVLRGLPFVHRVKIGPPRHLTSFINLTIQFIAYASNQIAGAIALPDFFAYLDYFARKDYGENYLDKEDACKIIKQELQSLVWSMNFEFRACQSAFTNLSMFDKYFMNYLFEKTVYPDNTFPNHNSISRLQEFYMRWFAEISKEQTFTFPVNTVNMYKDENGEIMDKEFLDIVSEINCYNGMFNIYTGDVSSISTCCRLRSDTGKLGYQNSLGAGGVSIGSSRVVTLNLAHIAYRSEDNTDFMKKLETYATQAQDILSAHYNIIEDNIKMKKLPLYFYNFMHHTRQFSTTGFIALNECCEIMGYDIASKDGLEFAVNVLSKLNDINTAMSKKDGRIRNLEQIPGESAAVSFAKKDKLLFNNHPYKIYSNQYIPLWKNVDIHERIRLQGIFDNMVGGGSIAHLNTSDPLVKEQMKTLITSAAKAGCIYYAVNMAMARCKTCGKLFIGKFEKSPCHNAEMTYYMRVVGFLTPVDSWIEARREEYNDRQFYTKENF